MKFTSFTHTCRKIKDVLIYVLYLKSFCVKNLATRKVFAFLTLIYSLFAFDNYVLGKLLKFLGHFTTMKIEQPRATISLQISPQISLQKYF